MCMQCVASGTVYVMGAVGALQVLRARAASQRGRHPRDQRKSFELGAVRHGRRSVEMGMGGGDLVEWPSPDGAQQLGDSGVPVDRT